jgi:hypothetical protein
LAKNYGNQRLSASRGSAEMAFSFKKQTLKVFLVHGETSPQMNCE